MSLFESLSFYCYVTYVKQVTGIIMSNINIMFDKHFYVMQNKSSTDISEPEPKKFDGTGYDKDLVEALERDIISQNPNVRW